MDILKITKDKVVKRLLGKSYVPQGLFELSNYFRLYGGITFESRKSEEGYIVARSTNFRYGSIITSGKDEQEVDRNIKDAILTSFEIPSAYLKEARLRREGTEKESVYALA